MTTVIVPGHGEVDFPDSMSDTEIAAAIQRNIASHEKPEIHSKDLGALHQFGTGAAEGFMRIGSGVRSGLETLQKTGELMQHGSEQHAPEKSWAPDILPNQQDINKISDYNRGSDWSTGGRLATDVATSYLPGAGASRLVKSLGRFAPTVADAAVSAGQGALTGNEGERGSAAAYGAGGSVAGSFLGSAAGRLVNPSGAIMPKSQALIDKGVPLTPAQMAPESGMGAFESLVAKVPGVGAVVRKRQKEAMDAGSAVLSRELGVPNLGPIEHPQHVLSELDKHVDDAYSQAVLAVAPDAFNKFSFDKTAATKRIGTLQGIRGGDARDVLRDITIGTDKLANAKTAAEKARIWKETDAAIGSKGAGFAPIQAMWRDSFHAIAGPKASQKMLEADMLHRYALGLNRGIGNRSSATPEQLVVALRGKDIDPSQIATNARQYVPMDKSVALGAKAGEVNRLSEDLAELATKQQSPWVLPQVSAAVGAGGLYGGLSGALLLPTMLAGAGAAAYTKPGLRYMTGQLGKKQRAIARFLREGTGKQLSRRASASFSEQLGEDNATQQ